MAAGRLVVPGWTPAVNVNGVPIPNAQMFFYLNRTTTLATVYADEALTAPLANPILANSAGQWPPVWADDANLFSVAIDAPYGPPGVPFTFDDLGPSTSSNAGALNKADRDGGNVETAFVENAPILVPELGSAERPLADKVNENLSLFDFGGTGTARLNAALSAAADRGRPVVIPSGAVLNMETAPVGGVFTLWAEGPYTRAGAFDGDIGGKLVQPSGTGLLYDPFYIGQHPNRDGTFKFEEAFRALAPDEGTGLRTLSSATLAVASPNGSNAGVFTSRSSDGGSIGSGFALAAYVINDKPYVSPESPAHGMWLFQGIAVRQALAGTTFGMEPGVVNNGSIEDRTPYYFYADGLTANLWLASGLPYLSANPLSMFIGCVYNGASAQRGIVFEKRALSDLGGGFGEAISVPEKTYFAQYVDLGDSGPGIIGATHAFGVTTYELGSRLTQDDSGVSTRGISTGTLWSNVNASGFQFGPDATPYVFGSVAGLTVTGGLVVGGIGAASNFTVLASETNVSHIEVLGGEIGGFPTIRAAGPASRIPLLLAGKGGSGIQFSVDYPFAANDAAAAAAGVGIFESYFNSSNFNALTVRLS